MILLKEQLKKMTKKELLEYAGSVEQLGGIREYTLMGGKADGMRAIEVNTGLIRFTVLPSRCMDIINCEAFQTPVAWVSKCGICSGEYYEPEGAGWLRNWPGGLVTTCGLTHVGGAYGEHGVHGRIANLPAQKVSVDAFWNGDDYIMIVSGEVRQSCAFGENLVLRRTITTKLFDDKFMLSDTIINEGAREENIALIYHCNFGFPLVSKNSKIIGLPEEHENISAPTPFADEAVYDIKFEGDMKTVGIENGEIGAYITYKRDTLPEFLLWKKFASSDYVVGLEPRNVPSAGEALHKNNDFFKLGAYEEVKTALCFSFKEL